MSRAAMLISPLLVLAAMPLLAMPAPVRAAELKSEPKSEPKSAEVDPIGVMLKSFEKDAVFTGRTKDGQGYVVMSWTSAFLIRPMPGGIMRVVVLHPKMIRSLIASDGWRL